ncbi:alkylhydroperoxidase family enzyme [Clostridium punense]|uniref:Alkylhydroperoxidase family enzyme n=1 Tax=Clostridium punense TaxID=1054297 RepID=A0ABS4K6G0_9CLOT|nr:MULTISPECIES: carboxymuconolactone decarboxylase family protein [Clostridium]EQB90434.1 hypothetical protein M918_00280 [Clostridium sp. BL8]MBP2023362.1 alkylhydroperoxidase family enzyme [Clostridium punense]
MAKIKYSKFGATPFQQLLGHNENILMAWSALENRFFTSTTFTPELKEEVRRTLAFNNRCEYCMAKGNPSDNITDSKIIIATEIADIISKGSIIKYEDFCKLKSQFSDEEISELLAFICFITASQRYGALLDLQPSCQIEFIKQ